MCMYVCARRHVHIAVYSVLNILFVYMCMYLIVCICMYIRVPTYWDAHIDAEMFFSRWMHGSMDDRIYGSTCHVRCLVAYWSLPMGDSGTVARFQLGTKQLVSSPSRFHHHVISCLPVPSTWLVFVQNKLDMIVAARRCWTCPHSSCNEHRKEKALKWSPPRKRTRHQKQFFSFCVKTAQIKRHLSYQNKIYSKHTVTEQLQFRILA